MRLPLLFSALCILGCGGLSEVMKVEGQEERWPAGVPQGFVRLEELDGQWGVVERCHAAERPGIFHEGRRVVVRERFDVQAHGSVRAVATDAEGYHVLFYDEDAQREAVLDLTWGDDTQTWLSWEGGRYVPEDAVGAEWPELPEPCAAT